MSLILNKQDLSFSPLWLSLACNELKVFGEFTTVSMKIEKFPNDIDGLILNIIKRIDLEFPNDLANEILCLISCSQIGLPESELSLLLKQINENSELNRLQWAHMLRSLNPFFKLINQSNIQIISFVHKRLNKVMYKIK